MEKIKIPEDTDERGVGVRYRRFIGIIDIGEKGRLIRTHV